MASGSLRLKGTLMVTTAKTQLGSDIITPSVAKSLISVTPFGIPTTRTADIPYVCNLELESDDTDLSPTKIAVLIAPPEDGTTTAASNSMIFKTYDLNTPIKGGDVIKGYGTNIIDGTTDPYFGASILISDNAPRAPQNFWNHSGAANSYGTGNDSYVVGATYRQNSVLRLVNAYAWACTNTTRTITDSIGGHFKLESSDFRTNLPQEYGYQVTFENDLGAGNNMTPTTLLWNIDVPCDPTCAITEYLDQEGLTAAGGIAWQTGISYNKNTRRV